VHAVKFSQVRLHAVEVCDHLFTRSRAFRTAAVAQFPALLEASVGFRPARPLPGPPQLATQLRERALDAVERWNDKYGVFYQQAGSHSHPPVLQITLHAFLFILVDYQDFGDGLAAQSTALLSCRA